ncbi:RDD family protein [Corynebacterium heidelbergense]|uniref:RDD domain-containing protein n=1 Tax=Corynebacterium heidelbergense TaxID=2055947 RepID=A0A364V6A9_9CORY|nr:hypothetical protein DLJ54_04680 [Corynebacterium heidelbergense]
MPAPYPTSKPQPGDNLNPYGLPQQQEGFLPTGEGPQEATPQPASAWRRFWGLCIDGLVQLAILALSVLCGYLATPSPEGRDPEDTTSLLLVIAPIFIASIVGILLWLVYRAGMESRFGASLGKMALGMRVQHLEGRRLNFGEAFRRNLWFTSGFAGVIPGGSLLPLILEIVAGTQISKDPRGQHFADRWAGAIVIRK